MFYRSPDVTPSFQQIKFMVDVGCTYRGCGINLTPGYIKFPYFAQGVDMKNEYPYVFIRAKDDKRCESPSMARN